MGCPCCRSGPLNRQNWLLCSRTNDNYSVRQQPNSLQDSWSGGGIDSGHYLCIAKKGGKQKPMLTAGAKDYNLQLIICRKFIVHTEKV